jgi:hypothetical protein
VTDRSGPRAHVLCSGRKSRRGRRARPLGSPLVSPARSAAQVAADLKWRAERVTAGASRRYGTDFPSRSFICGGPELSPRPTPGKDPLGPRQNARPGLPFGRAQKKAPAKLGLKCRGLSANEHTHPHPDHCMVPVEMGRTPAPHLIKFRLCSRGAEQARGPRPPRATVWPGEPPVG